MLKITFCGREYPISGTGPVYQQCSRMDPVHNTRVDVAVTVRNYYYYVDATGEYYINGTKVTTLSVLP